MHGAFPANPASLPSRPTAGPEVRARDATVAGARRTGDQRTVASPSARSTGTLPRLLPAGWPLSALFLGFPLWWALGLGTFAFILFAIPMAVDVLSRRGLRAPRGFGGWLVFLVWMVAGAAMLWSDAPGAEPGGGGAGRLTVYGYRLAMYLACTVVLLYVVNARERDISTTRILRLLGFMFVVTTCGGLLGVVAPTFEFRSLMEIVLPHGLASNEFVLQLIHPAAADVQDFLGYAEARPIAPFPFANSWGANFSLYLPFFLLAWLGRGAGWRRWVAPFILLAGVVPTVYSLNRGLWLALGVGACYLAARLALLGRYWAVNLIGVALVMGAVAFLASPLGTLVQQRIETPHSNTRRADLATATVAGVVEGSPVLGFGSTRDVRGNFFSIAGGSTADCPSCGAPPLGTQGQIWLVIFSQGVVGLALFLAFFLRRFLAHWRDPAPLAIAGCCALVFFGIELFVYDTFDAPMVTVMIAIGLLARRGPAPVLAPARAGGSL